MIRVLLPLAPLMIGAAAYVLANGLFNTLTALRMSSAGFSESTIGIVVACHFSGFVLASLTCQRIIGAIGPIRCFVTFTAFMAASTLAFPLLVEPIPWMVLRFAFGFCFCGTFMVIESWLAGGTPRESRGRVLASYMIVNKGMFGVGQFLLLVADPEGDRLFMLAAMLYALCLIPMAVTRAKDPAHLGSERLSFAALWQISPVSVVAAATAGVVNSSMLGLLPVFAVAIQFSVEQVSYLMAAFLGGSLFLQYPIGRLSDRLDRRGVLLGVIGVIAVCCAAITLFAGGGLPGLVVLALIVGGLTSTVYPLALSHANDKTPAEQTVSLVASLTLAFGIGSIIGPAAIAWMMEELTPNALFYAVAVANAILLLFIGYRMKVQPRTDAAETSDFVMQPQTSQSTAAISGLSPNLPDRRPDSGAAPAVDALTGDTGGKPVN